MVRVEDYTDDLGSNPQLELLNAFVLDDPRKDSTYFVNGQLVCLKPFGIITGAVSGHPVN